MKKQQAVRKQYNRRKFPIFNFIARANRSITALDIMEAQGISRNNADNRLWKMQKQGYLLKSQRGHYRLSTKGRRVRERLLNRKEIEKVVGEPISFNLNKRISHDVTQKYFQLTGKPAPTNI